jgi:hypothetical protein
VAIGWVPAWHALHGAEITTRESFDLNIGRLAAAIDAFDGLTVIGGCAGHLDPQTDQALFTLEFLAWAISNDYRRGGHQVLLSPIAPHSTLMRLANRSSSWSRALVGANATILATWLNRLRAEC